MIFYLSLMLAALFIATVYKKSTPRHREDNVFYSVIGSVFAIFFVVVILGGMVFTDYQKDYSLPLLPNDSHEYLSFSGTWEGEPQWYYKTTAGERIFLPADSDDVMHTYRANGKPRVELQCPHSYSFIVPFNLQSDESCNLNFYVPRSN